MGPRPAKSGPALPGEPRSAGSVCMGGGSLTKQPPLLEGSHAMQCNGFAKAGGPAVPPPPPPSARGASPPLVIRGEDAPAGRIVPIFGLPQAGGAAFLLVVGLAAGHGCGVQGRGPGRGRSGGSRRRRRRRRLMSAHVMWERLVQPGWATPRPPLKGDAFSPRRGGGHVGDRRVAKDGSPLQTCDRGVRASGWGALWAGGIQRRSSCSRRNSLLRDGRMTPSV